MGADFTGYSSMIPVQNIYYMLSYAFHILREQGYKELETEVFPNTAELFSEIMIKWISTQLKRGIEQEYVMKFEPTFSPKGKIHVTDSVRSSAYIRKELICSYDEMSVNTYRHQIIKTTIYLLLRANVSLQRKKKLRRLLSYFNDVDQIDVRCIKWNRVYHKQNRSYEMIISVCYLIVNGLLHTQKDGTMRLMDYLDEQKMWRLYEKFIYEFYKQEYPMLQVTSSQIKWQLDDDYSENLPIMQSDIMLSYEEKILIIDTKYYSSIMQTNGYSHTIRSNHLYQIFAYVKNKEHELKDVSHKVGGLLLYAKTDEVMLPDNTYLMSGNEISVSYLDLSGDFSLITERLSEIVYSFFGVRGTL